MESKENKKEWEGIDILEEKRILKGNKIKIE